MPSYGPFWALSCISLQTLYGVIVKLNKMNLTIGVRSRRRLVPRVQVWVFWVIIRWRARILVRVGRVGSEYRVERLDSRFQSEAVTRDCGKLPLFDGRFGIYVKLWVIYGTFGHVRVFLVGLTGRFRSGRVNPIKSGPTRTPKVRL